eukprot:CAMPEP_0176447562 /NCGR_PEP_ID=MMETSP0127-20121128/25130_1 /TAXON_ID=938130 /ORGANISM="Platyophrya macrostoma, Strain WH" /LENGTH=528 /DNA_ID=CAMNT_0017834081 /DNA_START=124 /DNA_END=1710 /DNA_ORIENTATION=-
MASLYVGDLDPNVRENQLLDVFKQCGTVLGVRVCRDIITQRSLGYGYVNFQNHADAEKAFDTLNFTRVGENYIRLMWQQRDPSQRYSGSGNIFVKNLSNVVDSKGLHDLFKRFGSILSCKVMTDEEGKSRGYGFVHFKEDTAANSAIEELNGKNESSSETHALYLAHFIRRNARIATLLANFTNVYIKQVLPTVDKDVIEKFFSKFGGIQSAAAKKDAKGRVFAFCNFSSHDDAVKAIESLHDNTVDGLTAPGEKLYVQRAQLRSERLVELRQKYMQRQSLGNNLYVRNFDADFKDENLHELFGQYGDIRSCRIMRDEKENSRGFGFVSFVTAEQANTALREMNGRMLNGKPLMVNIAQRRDQRYSMLQVQFQQRIQAMMRQLPMVPFVANQPRRPMRGPKGPHQQQAQPLPPHRVQVGRGRGGQAQEPYTVPRTPQQSPGIAPETPPLAPITADELQSMSVEDQKVAIGERLYVKISEITPEYAPKITGMLLEMDSLEALALLENVTELAKKVEEALCVLRAHEISN